MTVQTLTNPGRLKDVVQKAVGHFAPHESPEYVAAWLAAAFPFLADKETCANCGASMRSTVYSVGIGQVSLLKAMGDAVAHRMTKGIPFTDANAVKVNDITTNDTIRHQTTISAYLGLVAKVIERAPDGRKAQRRNTWLITERGYAFLRNEPVPAERTVYHGEIIDRPGATVTLSEIVAQRRTYEEERKRVGMLPERIAETFDDYDPHKYFAYGPIVPGRIV